MKLSKRDLKARICGLGIRLNIKYQSIFKTNGYAYLIIYIYLFIKGIQMIKVILIVCLVLTLGSTVQKSDSPNSINGINTVYQKKLGFKVQRQINLIKYSLTEQIMVAMNRNDQTITIYNTYSYQQLQIIPLGFTPNNIAVSSRGSYIAIMNINGTLVIINRRRSSEDQIDTAQSSEILKDFQEETFEFETKPFFSVDLTEIGKCLSKTSQQNDEQVNALVEFSFDQDLIVIANGKGNQIDVYTISSTEATLRDQFTFVTQPIASISWGTFSDNLLVAGGVQPDMDALLIYRYNKNSKDYEEKVRTTQYGILAAFSLSENSVLVSGDIPSSSLLHLLDSSTLTQKLKIDMKQTGFTSVSISSDQLAVSAIRQKKLSSLSANLKKFSNLQQLTANQDGIFTAIRPNALSGFDTIFSFFSTETSASGMSPNTNEILLTRFDRQTAVASRCSNGTVYIQNQCINCPLSCDFCSNSNECVKCDQAHYVNIEKTCTLCVAPCLACSSAAKCVTCIEGYHINDQSFCVQNTFPIWAIILIVALVVLIIAAIGLFVFMKIRSSKKKKEEPLVAEEKYDAIQ